MLLGPEPRGVGRLLRKAPRGRANKDASGSLSNREQPTEKKNMTSRWNYGGGSGGAASGAGYGAGPEAVREPGTRRKKFASMAGSVYRASVAAASELKEQYNNTRIRGVEPIDSHQITIPGSFPNVAIVTKGNEQMVLFPSYAKRHIKQYGKKHTERPPEAQSSSSSSSQTSFNGEDYWKEEWARLEDEKAIVDVDVRGWVYTPHTGPMTRRNRVLIGLARRLSGIPPPTVHDQQSMTSMHEEHERMREEQKIAKEAREIEKRGQQEKEAANRGGYSEAPKGDDSDGETESIYLFRSRSGRASPLSVPSSPILAAKNSSMQPGELTEAELVVANSNLMARLGPFLTNPLVESPVTLFFYNDTQSQSRTVMTNDSGHFITRVALDFVPTHVRVLAAESSLSVTEPVKVIESSGISLISDIDDTIKRSSISLGAREIFRNTFIRDLGDLAVEGVKEWYNSLHDMGVNIHYCSNSPWQLFPVLASFFQIAGLPPGSIHLKQYSGMLQGIFEPVAERKKGTLEKILRDFPQRRFLLVGDSGEADLEVYTELVVANPGRILAVFIRDVTTPELAKYFDSSFGSGGLRRSQTTRPELEDGVDTADRPALPPRIVSAPTKPEAAATGDLIDLSDEPEQMAPSEGQRLGEFKSGSELKTSVSNIDLLARKQPPPRPVKPPALRSTPSEVGLGISSNDDLKKDASSPPTPRTRKSTGPQLNFGTQHPLAQMQNLSDQRGSNTSLPKSKEPAAAAASSNTPSSNNSTGSKQGPPAPPLPRRTGTVISSLHKLSPRLSAQSRKGTANSDIDFEPLPSPSFQRQSLAASPPSTNGANSPIGMGGSPAFSKKVDMWQRRLARAHDTLQQHGVQLYTWRKGDDVIVEAVGIVKQAMEDLERKRRR